MYKTRRVNTLNKTTRLFFQILLVQVVFLNGCVQATTTVPPTSTLTSTSTPIPPTLTPQPTLTETPTPSILEGHEFALAYAEQGDIQIVDENGDKIASVHNDAGWIYEFEISPDNRHIILSPMDKKDDDLYWYGYGLHIQTLGNKKDTVILPQDIRILFFHWIDNEHFLVITPEATFLWSLDGTAQVVEKHPGLFAEVSNSVFRATTAPDKNTILITQSQIKLKDSVVQPSVCTFFILNAKDWRIDEIAKSEICLVGIKINWSPDSKYASISFGEEEENVRYPVVYVLRAQSKEIFDSKRTMLHDLLWSPNGAYYAFNDNLLSLSVGIGDLEQEEDVFQYNPQSWVSLQSWSPDSQYLLFREGRNYATLSLQDMTIKPVLALPDFQFLPDGQPLVWWSPNSKSIYFLAADDTGANGVYLYDLQTNKPKLIAEFSKPLPPYYMENNIMLSPDNKYSLIYFMNAEGKPIYVIIENQAHTVKAQIEVLGPLQVLQLLK